MSIPSDWPIAQGMLVYNKATMQPFQVRCNCSSSPPLQTARYVAANRHLFMTPEQFLAQQKDT